MNNLYFRSIFIYLQTSSCGYVFIKETPLICPYFGIKPTPVAEKAVPVNNDQGRSVLGKLIIFSYITHHTFLLYT